MEMTGSKRKNEGGSRQQEDSLRRSGGSKGIGGHKAAIIALIALAVCAIVIVAALANTSFSRLSIEEDDHLMYAIQSYESTGNYTGSLTIWVTSVSVSSFVVRYSITIHGNTTNSEVEFTGASGGWAANIGNVVGRLSGSDAKATFTNSTTLGTAYGSLAVDGYTITTTTPAGANLRFDYWLDVETRCPYLIQFLYGNGDMVTCSLEYTDIDF